MRIFIHAHVFYPEHWPEIKNCLANLMEYPCETHITIPVGHAALRSTIMHDMPTCCLSETENTGFDIGPFFRVIKDVDIAAFDYIAKIHTKRNISCIKNNHIFIGGAWRRLLLAPFANKKLLKRSLGLFKSNPQIGMIAHHAVIFSHDDSEMTYAAEQLLATAGLRVTSHRFVAGTMFLTRTKAVLPLLSKINDITNNSAYAVERAFGFSVSASGYKITDPYNLLRIYESTYNLRGRLISLIRLLFQITIKSFVKDIPTFKQLSRL